MMMGIGIPINQRRIPRPIKLALSFYCYIFMNEFMCFPEYIYREAHEVRVMQLSGR